MIDDGRLLVLAALGTAVGADLLRPPTRGRRPLSFVLAGASGGDDAGALQRLAATAGARVTSGELVFHPDGRVTRSSGSKSARRRGSRT